MFAPNQIERQAGKADGTLIFGSQEKSRHK
jgi:hypothetical protein